MGDATYMSSKILQQDFGFLSEVQSSYTHTYGQITPQNGNGKIEFLLFLALFSSHIATWGSRFSCLPSQSYSICLFIRLNHIHI